MIYSTFLYLQEVLKKLLNNCLYLILYFSAVAQQTFQEIVTTFNFTSCVTQNLEITAANNCSILMIIKRNTVQLARNIQTNFDGRRLFKNIISYNDVLFSSINLVQVVRFECLTLVLLRIQVHWDVMPCQWANGVSILKNHNTFILKDQGVLDYVPLKCQDPKHLTTQHHNADLYPWRKLCCQ